MMLKAAEASRILNHRYIEKVIIIFKANSKNVLSTYKIAI